MEQKRGEGTQLFKKGVSKLGQGVSALKMGAGTSLRNLLSKPIFKRYLIYLPIPNQYLPINLHLNT